MNLPQPPPGALVLARHPEAERAAMRRLTTGVAVQGVMLGIVVVALLGLLAIALGMRLYSILISGVGLLAAGFAVTVALVQLLRFRRAEAAVRGAALWISPDGVTFAGPSGVFPAPWPAVRRARFQGRLGGRGTRADALHMEVGGWGGPATLRLPLDGTGVNRDTIARAVHELSRGRVTVTA